jgi:hypothetical protein
LYRYAIINEEGIVYGVSQLAGEVIQSDMILISDDFDVINKKYVNGEWVDYTPEPIPETIVEPTNSEIAQTQLTMMEAMADQYEQNLKSQITSMEVQATIYETLLDIQGGTTP